MLGGKWSLVAGAAGCCIAAVSLGCGGGTTSPPAKSGAPAAAESEPAETEPTTSAEAPEAETPSDAPAPTADSSTPDEPAAETSAASSGAVEEGWGHLMGRFVYDGEAPRQGQLNVNKDVEFCTKKHPLDESLVVNSANGGVRDVIVWLYLGRGDEAPKLHPSYAESAATPVRLDNEWCRFEPHVQLVQTSQTLVVGNKDEVGHNTKCDPFNNPGFNLTVPTGQEITQTFAKAERLPADVSCSIHPWMTGLILIQDHPYMAVSDDEGNFNIQNLPAGKWTFQVWHKLPGYVDNVSLGGKATEWRRGRAEFEIKSGDNNLGDIKLKPALFNK